MPLRHYNPPIIYETQTGVIAEPVASHLAGKVVLLENTTESRKFICFSDGSSWTMVELL